MGHRNNRREISFPPHRPGVPKKIILAAQAVPEDHHIRDPLLPKQDKIPRTELHVSIHDKDPLIGSMLYPFAHCCPIARNTREGNNLNDRGIPCAQPVQHIKRIIGTSIINSNDLIKKVSLDKTAMSSSTSGSCFSASLNTGRIADTLSAFLYPYERPCQTVPRHQFMCTLSFSNAASEHRKDPPYVCEAACAYGEMTQ
jgi:hypothetical protein